MEDHLNIRNGAGVPVLNRRAFDVAVIKQDLAVRGCLKPHQNLRECRLTAAGFAHNRERFRFPRLKAEGLVGLHNLLVATTKERRCRDLIVFLEVVHLKNHIARFCLGLLLTHFRRRGPVDLFELQTARGMAIMALHIFHEDILRVTAAFLKVVTARAKVTARRPLVGQGEVPRDRHQWTAFLVGTWQRNRAEQRLRIRVLHLVKDVFNRATLDRFTGIHHAKPVAGFQNQTKVVRDKQHRGAVFLAQILHEFHNSRLNGHIKRCGRLVQNQQCRFGHQRHRNHDPLLLTTRQLVWERIQHPLRVWQAHICDHFQRPRIGFFFRHTFVDHRHFHQLLADLHRRVQRGHRFLIDHRDLIAAHIAQLFVAHLAQIAALELDRAANDAAVLAQILHDAQGHSGFTAARFSNKANGFARLHGD